MTGPLAMIGGSEWTPGCDFDAELLEATRVTTVVVLPTAAAFENPGKAVARAREWFAVLGAEVHEVPVFRRSEAAADDVVHTVREASLIYLADGSAAHLRSVLKDTPLYDALVAAWHGGAGLAASGQAAAALCETMVDARGGAFTVGLGVLSTLTVIPRYDDWSREKVHRTVRMAPAGLPVVGVDDRTAIVRDVHGVWSVRGAGRAAVFCDHKEVGFDALGGR